MTDQDRTDLEKNDDPSADAPAPKAPVSSEPVSLEPTSSEPAASEPASCFDVEGIIAQINQQLEADPSKYAAKRRPLNPVAVMLHLLAMMMFVGGTAVSLMLVARSFELHGNVLVAFVVFSAAAVLGMAGSFLCKILGDSERWLAGAVFGACLGAMSALIFYGQTRNYGWWQ